MAYCSSVTVNRCASVALPVHQRKVMSKVASCSSWGLGDFESFPSSFTPSSRFHSTVVGTGPPSGSCVS